MRRWSLLALLLLAPMPAHAAVQGPEQMMAQCRSRAGAVLRTRLPNIDTKYEGQRTNGTHAVNGTAVFGGRSETFQCSFNRSGSRIVRFVVNKPSPPVAPATSARSACLAAVRSQVNRTGLSVISVRRGETSTIVLVRVPGALAPWRCEHGPGGVQRAFYTRAG